MFHGALLAGTKRCSLGEAWERRRKDDDVAMITFETVGGGVIIETHFNRYNGVQEKWSLP